MELFREYCFPGHCNCEGRVGEEGESGERGGMGNLRKIFKLLQQ